MRNLLWSMLGTCLMLVGCSGNGRAQQVDAYLGRCKEYLVKDDTLYNWFSVDAQGIAMYSDPAAKLADSAECRLYWDELEGFGRLSRQLDADSLLRWYLAKGDQRWKDAPDAPKQPVLPPYDPSQPLRGLRIALDPGHVGGSMEMGMLEFKAVKILPGAWNSYKDTISFNEGNLALGTALILDSMFRAAGAEVLLTRSSEGETAFGYSFVAWLDTMQVRWEKSAGKPHRTVLNFNTQNAWEHYRDQCAAAMYLQDNPAAQVNEHWWMNKAGRISIYKTPFLRAEFKERARKIQAFGADLSLIIHYNVLETNEPDMDGFRAAVADNYCMAFLPGAFMAGELSTPFDRLLFLVKLATNDAPVSAALSDSIIKAHQRLLGVPPLREGNGLKYIENASMPFPGATAVYARNLALTRQVHGVMCFGESLYQDNISEAMRLNAKDFVLPGMQTPMPNRIREVAQAYFDGVLAWRQTAK